VQDEYLSTAETLDALSKMVAVVIASESGDVDEASSLVEALAKMLSDKLVVELFGSSNQTLN
jgi:hypothetical protein